jgi:hypothetical protein
MFAIAFLIWTSSRATSNTRPARSSSLFLALTRLCNPNLRTWFLKQQASIQRLTGTLSLGGVEAAAIAAQQSPQLGSGQCRSISIHEVLGQACQMQDGRVL